MGYSPRAIIWQSVSAAAMVHLEAHGQAGAGQVRFTGDDRDNAPIVAHGNACFCIE